MLDQTDTAPSADSRHALRDAYRAVRDETERRAAPLTAEDQTVQSMPDASPAKWHRAHTTWFFETFVLLPHAPRLPPCSTRPSATCSTPTTRPSAPAIPARRAACSAAPASPRSSPLPRPRGRRRWTACSDVRARAWPTSSLIGLHHEQQHQELLLTDIKHAFSCSRSCPPTRPPPAAPPGARCRRSRWMAHRGRHPPVGHSGARAFASTTRLPRAPTPAAALRASPTARSAMASSGVHGRRRLPPARAVAVRRLGHVQARRLGRAALLARDGDGGWQIFTPARPAGGPGRRAGVPRQLLRGRRLRRWAGAPPADRVRVGGRGPLAARARTADASSAPAPAAPRDAQDVWEWTASAYLPYPGYHPAPGRARRIQRQVHDEPDGAARPLLRHAAGPRAPDLPQLLPPACALAVLGLPAGKDL